MKINSRQEIAMWVLGLLWTGFAFLALSQPAAISGSTVAIMFIFLIPIALVLFSLRDRNKPN
jgi:hypothetical protein